MAKRVPCAAQNRSAVREQQFLAEISRKPQSRIRTHIKINPSILQTLLKRGIKTLDDVKVDLWVPSTKWLEHLRQQPKMRSNRESDCDAADGISTQLLEFIARALYVVQKSLLRV